MLSRKSLAQHFSKIVNMQEENISPQQSLELIKTMIAKTRKDMGDNSSNFLLWGWVSFVACMGQFF